MNTRVFLGASVMALATVLASPSAWAVAPDQLARDSGCLSCHSMTEKIVGPSYKSVAEKYKGQPDAVGQLVQSVRNGSKGHWGRIPMPAHPSLSDAELKQLVTWVLAQ